MRPRGVSPSSITPGPVLYDILDVPFVFLDHQRWSRFFGPATRNALFYSPSGSDFQLKVDVSDADGDTDTATKNVTVTSCAPPQLGIGENGASGGILVRPVPTRVLPERRFVALAAGAAHACALTAEETVWCWGANESNQLGEAAVGELSDVPVPVELPFP